jgi:hypothetical protein
VSIVNVLTCTQLFYGFLVLLDRSTIVLCRHRADPLETYAISPVIGLSAVTLLTTYLSFLDIPLDTVSKNMTLGIGILATITLAKSAPFRALKTKGH